MSFSYPSISEIGANAWDSLVRSSPDGWVFSLFGWQEIVTSVETWGFVERSFGVCMDNRLVAVMPLHFRPSQLVASSSGWGGSGPVIDTSLSGTKREQAWIAALSHAVELATVDGAQALELSCSPVTTASLTNRWGVNPFQLHGFEDKSLLSQIIDLSQSEEALWAGLTQSARQAVRKAQKAGYRAERVDWLANLDAYYSCHVETYQRTGVEPHPRAYFEGLARRTAPSNASVLYAALAPSGEPVAFHNDARLGVGANYHTGCSRSGVRGEGIDYLLMWEALRKARDDGFKWYDCGWVFPGATDSKQKGLTLFKTRFGGEPHRSFSGRKNIPLKDMQPSAPENITTEASRRNSARFSQGLRRLARKVLGG